MKYLGSNIFLAVREEKKTHTWHGSSTDADTAPELFCFPAGFLSAARPQEVQVLQGGGWGAPAACRAAPWPRPPFAQHQSCSAQGACSRSLPHSPRCLLSAAPAATGSQFVTASACVLPVTSIAQLMLKSILVLILGHD